MENDSDYEQVFVVNDTDDSFGDEHKTFGRKRESVFDDRRPITRNSGKKSEGGAEVLVAGIIIVVSLIVFVSMFLSIGFNMTPDQIGPYVFILLVFCFMAFSMFVFFNSKSNSVELTPCVQRTTVYNENTSKRRKKFNNLQEYQASQEFQRHNAELASRQTAKQRKDEERSKDIDVAIKALISLGFKIKRATHLVSLALDSGISHKETQMLVKYALSNNNKA